MLIYGYLQMCRKQLHPKMSVSSRHREMVIRTSGDDNIAGFAAGLQAL